MSTSGGSIYSDIEAVLEAQHSNYLSVLEERFSVQVKVFRAVQNVYSNVYGREAGEENLRVVSNCLDVVMVGDGFFASDARSAGAFEEGWLFTNSECVQVGDRIELLREDCRHRRYKVISLERVGSTRAVFRKFKLSALGD